jgi:hypothetical protein
MMRGNLQHLRLTRLGTMQSPDEDEKSLTSKSLPLLSARPVRTPTTVACVGGGAGGGMSFLRYGEIYPCYEDTIWRPYNRSSPGMSLELVIPGRVLQ